jgi:hypothetical protein
MRLAKKTLLTKPPNLGGYYPMVDAVNTDLLAAEDEKPTLEKRNFLIKKAGSELFADGHFGGGCCPM